MKDTDVLQLYDPISRTGHNVTIKELRECLLGVKQEKPMDAPKKTRKKDEK